MPDFKLTQFEWSPRWYITWSDGRRSQRATTGTTDREQAQRVLAAFIIERGSISETALDKVSISAVLNDYYDGYACRLSSKDVTRLIIQKLELHYGVASVSVLTGPLGHKSYEDHCRKNGLKPSTINRRRAVLRAALTHAYRNGRLQSVPYVPTLQEGPPRPDFLTRTQAARLLWAARRLPHIALFIRIAIWTGARHSAILQLTWDRVDLIRGVVDFRLPGIEHRKKKRAVRPIPLLLLATLRRHARHATSGHLITWNGQVVKSVKKAFRTLRKETGLPVSPHTLKHTAVTWGLQKATVHEMSQLTATSTKTLERVYAKAEVEHLRDAAERAARGGARKPRATAKQPAQPAGAAKAAQAIVNTGRVVGAGEGIRTLDPDLGKDQG
jgi:integrase